MKSTPQAPRYITEPSDAPIWVTEPFRVFFPLGMIASLFGVLIWPLFYGGVWPYPPHFQHPRILIFGFGFAFVVGFLGTAWPRFLEGAAMRRSELALLVATWLAAQIAYGMYQLRIGDGLFALHVLTLLLILASRVREKKITPPPGFALAFGSVVMGFAVALTWTIFPVGLSDSVTLFLKLLAYQGLLLLPILGVGSYLFGRFFHAPGERPIAAPPKQRALGVWLGAAWVLISFGIEAIGWVRVGNGVRFGAMILWAILAAPAVWRATIHTTRAWALRLGLGTIAASFLIRAITPGPGYAIEHLLFLGGFGLLILLVADRVSIGHAGGDFQLLPSRSKLWRWLAWLTLLAALTRASADYKASLLISHHVYAALLWATILVIWVIFHQRHWRKTG